MAKAKHKHIYKPCLLKSENPHGACLLVQYSAYCEICGKVNQYELIGDSRSIDKNASHEKKQEFFEDWSGIDVFEVNEISGTKQIVISEKRETLW